MALYIRSQCPVLMGSTKLNCSWVFLNEISQEPFLQVSELALAVHFHWIHCERMARAISSSTLGDQKHTLLGETLQFSFTGFVFNRLSLWTVNFGMPTQGSHVSEQQMRAVVKSGFSFSSWASPLISLCLNFPICKCLLPSVESVIDLLLPPAE